MRQLEMCDKLMFFIADDDWSGWMSQQKKPNGGMEEVEELVFWITKINSLSSPVVVICFYIQSIILCGEKINQSEFDWSILKSISGCFGVFAWCNT